jgi:hypothetical protein
MEALNLRGKEAKGACEEGAELRVTLDRALAAPEVGDLNPPVRSGRMDEDVLSHHDDELLTIFTGEWQTIWQERD